MRVDLQKVDAEIAALRSTLAAIDNDLDECRQRYFQYPWAWPQIRRNLSFERYRLQRRLEEFIFTRNCAGGRTCESAPVLSFRSLVSPDERNTGPDATSFLALDLTIKKPDHVVRARPMEERTYHGVVMR
jgi:hypothetical protein